LPLYVFDENKLLLKLFRHFKGTSDQKKSDHFWGPLCVGATLKLNLY